MEESPGQFNLSKLMFNSQKQSQNKILKPEPVKNMTTFDWNFITQ